MAGMVDGGPGGVHAATPIATNATVAARIEIRDVRRRSVLVIMYPPRESAVGDPQRQATGAITESARASETSAARPTSVR